jgi:O-antigen ligase
MNARVESSRLHLPRTQAGWGRVISMATLDSGMLETSSPPLPRLPLPELRNRIALRVLQIGSIAVVLASLPYKAFDLDRYFVPKELVLHVCAAVAAVLLLRARPHLTLSVIDAVLAAFLLFGVVSALFAVNVWAAERALAISCSGVVLFGSASAVRRAGLTSPLLVALAVGIVLAAATSLAQAYGVQTEYFSLNRAPGGTFGNRNFIAHLSAIGLPVVALVALTARRGAGSILGGLAMAIIAAALVMSRSRAAWLAVLVLAAPVGVLAASTWRRWCEPRTLRRLIVLGVAAGAGAIAAVLLPNRLEWKSDSPYLDSAAGLVNYKAGSGRGRIVQYTNSLRMTGAHPVFGVGPGNWPVVYPHYASRNDPSMSSDDGVTSNPWPSSDWVAYLSERGAIGIALLLVAMVGLLGRALADLKRQDRNAEQVLTAIALVGTLVATAVVGAFDAVLLIAAPTFFVWTLAGVLSPTPDGGFTLGRWASVTAMLGVVLYGGIAITRSSFQLAAITTFSTSTRLASLDHASSFDPGSYRIHARLAASYLSRGDCARARPHARAARALFPSAVEPRRVLASCGSK